MGDSIAPDCYWYALADSAQDGALPAAINTLGQSHCLFETPDDSPLAKCAPHLVRLAVPRKNDGGWTWLDRHASSAPCVTIIASPHDFEPLLNHLKRCLEVRLPGNDLMILAFWDPAILGVLVGQHDDTSMHVPGPVFTPSQRSLLTNPMAAWWYWDRRGEIHRIVATSPPAGAVAAEFPFTLTQAQVDELVEASVPDHVLNYVELNQPQLVRALSPAKRYDTVRNLLVGAHDIGLETMADLVNYTCAALIYGARFHDDPNILGLLREVNERRLTLDGAMDRFP